MPNRDRIVYAVTKPRKNGKKFLTFSMLSV